MTPTFEVKVWGRTIPVVETQFYSKHHLEVTTGGYCSLHFHRHRANRFKLEAGLVEIIEMYAMSVKRTRLFPGATYDVPSLIPHMFVVHSGGTMLEEYFPDRGGSVRSDDIVRLIIGGKLPVDRLNDLPGLIIPGLTELP